MEGTEQDVHNFSTSSSHRLPTISAVEALQQSVKCARGLSTSLPSLDLCLLSDAAPIGDGGIKRGRLTEIYGPPGVGKTSLALQVAVNTVHLYDDQSGVIWIDTGSPVVPRRVSDMMKAYRLPEVHEPPSSPPEPRFKRDLLKKMSYFHVHTLPQLLVMFLHPSATFPPAKSVLMVVDDLSNLVLGSFPKSGKLKKAEKLKNGLYEKLSRKAANKKWAIIAELAEGMAKLAASKNIAILVNNQTVTSQNGGRKAALKSALSTQSWDSAVQDRVLLYRDYPVPDLESSILEGDVRRLRYAEVVKHQGKENTITRTTSFVIDKAGLRQVGTSWSLTEQSQLQSAPPASSADIEHNLKRKAEEIADSDDEIDETAFNGNPDISEKYHADNEIPQIITNAELFNNPFRDASDGELTASDDDMERS